MVFAQNLLNNFVGSYMFAVFATVIYCWFVVIVSFHCYVKAFIKKKKKGD